MSREDTVRLGYNEIISRYPQERAIIEKELSTAWGNGHGEGYVAGLQAAIQILQREKFLHQCVEKGESDEL